MITAPGGGEHVNEFLLNRQNWRALLLARTFVRCNTRRPRRPVDHYCPAIPDGVSSSNDLLVQKHATFIPKGGHALGTCDTPPGSSARWGWMNRRSTPPRPLSRVAAGIAIVKSSSTSITRPSCQAAPSRSSDRSSRILISVWYGTPRRFASSRVRSSKASGNLIDIAFCRFLAASRAATTSLSNFLSVMPSYGSNW